MLTYPSSGLVKGVAKAPEIAEDDLNIMFATNVTGLINLTQAILPIFQKRPNGGQGDIINIGSIAGMPFAHLLEHQSSLNLHHIVSSTSMLVLKSFVLYRP